MNSAYVKFLYAVNSADSESTWAEQGQAVGIVFGVELAHVLDLFEVDTRVDKLLVGCRDDGGSVGAGEYVFGLCWFLGVEFF